MKKILLHLAACLLFVALPVKAQALKEISFGISSTESSQNLKSDWQPILDDLARKTGLKVSAFFASDYAGIIEGMRFNMVDVAWYGNKAAMEAVDRSRGEVFAKMMNADGTEGYYSHLIVHKDSPIKTLDDMLKNGKSLSFGNGDPNSTSGFLVPGYYVFSQNRIDAKTFFKLSRSANHEANALAVANKQIDVATNNSESLEKIRERQPDRFQDIRIIWTSPLIPADPLVMRKDLPEPVKAKIREFFYAYGGNAQEKSNLFKLNKLSGFKPSSNSQLIPIRQLELFKTRNKLATDDSLTAAEKQSRLDEIDKQLLTLVSN